MVTTHAIQFPPTWISLLIKIKKYYRGKSSAHTRFLSFTEQHHCFGHNLIISLNFNLLIPTQRRIERWELARWVYVLFGIVTIFSLACLVRNRVYAD